MDRDGRPLMAPLTLPLLPKAIVFVIVTAFFYFAASLFLYLMEDWDPDFPVSGYLLRRDQSSLSSISQLLVRLTAFCQPLMRF